MKKSLSVFIALLVFAFCLVLPASAAEATTDIFVHKAFFEAITAKQIIKGLVWVCMLLLGALAIFIIARLIKKHKR